MQWREGAVPEGGELRCTPYAYPRLHESWGGRHLSPVGGLRAPCSATMRGSPDSRRVGAGSVQLRDRAGHTTLQDMKTEQA